MKNRPRGRWRARREVVLVRGRDQLQAQWQAMQGRVQVTGSGRDQRGTYLIVKRRPSQR